MWLITNFNFFSSLINTKMPIVSAGYCGKTRFNSWYFAPISVFTYCQWGHIICSYNFFFMRYFIIGIMRYYTVPDRVIAVIMCSMCIALLGKYDSIMYNLGYIQMELMTCCHILKGQNSALIQKIFNSYISVGKFTWNWHIFENIEK